MKKQLPTFTSFIFLLLSSCTMHNPFCDCAMFHSNETHTGIYEEGDYKNFGEIKWKFKTNGIIHTSPALYDSTIYIGSWDTYLYAIDAITGKEKWKFFTVLLMV